jgi:hypothetical protein
MAGWLVGRAAALAEDAHCQGTPDSRVSAGELTDGSAKQKSRPRRAGTGSWEYLWSERTAGQFHWLADAHRRLIGQWIIKQHLREKLPMVAGYLDLGLEFNEP